jgi:carboxyl-terminal processing protease
MSKMNKIIITLAALLIIGLSFSAGLLFGLDNPYSQGTGPAIIDQAWSLILTEYIDQEVIDTEALSHGAIRGMLQVLDDPYSSFLEADEYSYLFYDDFQGIFEGIGAYIGVREGQLTIIAPIADSPAEKAGIKAGDIILEIDGESVENMSFAEAILKIRGPRGTLLKLLVTREGESEPFIIEITREEIEMASVRLEMKGEFAHITIIDFTERTGQEMGEVLRDIDENTTRGIILDLRGNPGGILGAVVEVASYFLDEDIILYTRDNQGTVSPINRFEVTPVIHLPIVMLVDSASASGSEVLAGALQDYDRAVIAGTRTYGKGSVVSIVELNDGSVLFLTTFRWLTPNQHLIEGQGIQPDIDLELTGEDAVQWAIDYLTEHY